MDGIGPTELGQWYSTHGAALVLFARQWLGDASAEDVVHEVFIRLMAQRHPPRQVRAWLFQAVRNAAISRLRSQTRRRRREQERAAAEWFVPQLDQGLDGDAVQEALAGLAIEQREIIVMRLWGGVTWEEAAESTGQAVSTLFSRYRAGLAALRERLGVPCDQTSSRPRSGNSKRP
jgi:RNA polymerase sigma-70 factor (ECF subfamily)